ncbi:conserved hypothetical protein [Neospora caninum Liverpool]|uniref:Uncharacterized protein n=1 Tax=Neospora caninum (strain Liverpool) TaxID=572307 RepID=F0VP24_NEOCL|nr:conserved hypothetical protein [Neospora caninum Liverpool]CBZ55470.1 conserved hypothetical protein [Neospora caninum Liverpool]CEL70207.1 TPA: hypothetical protein BN1204_058930 [Neospora caninum Liverpool]|eukprot:XP_003885498.1 conserved hypothetical protein [Neospora caninum Liverpool]
MRSAKGAGPSAQSGTACPSSIPPSVAPFFASCSPRFAKQLTDISRRLSLPLSTLQVEAIHRLLALALEKENQAFPAHLQASVALLFHTLRSPWQLADSLSPGLCTPQEANWGGVSGASRAPYLQQAAFLPSVDAAVALAGSSVSIFSSSLSFPNTSRCDAVFDAFPPLIGALIHPGVALASVRASVAAVRAAALSALVQLVSSGLLELHRVTDEILASAAALERAKDPSAEPPKSSDFLIRVDLASVLPEGLQRLFFSSLLQAALTGRLAVLRCSAASSAEHVPPLHSALSATRRGKTGECEVFPPSCAVLSNSASLLSKALQRLAAFDGRVVLSILEPLGDVLLACCSASEATQTATATEPPVSPVSFSASSADVSHTQCLEGSSKVETDEKIKPSHAGQRSASRRGLPPRQEHEALVDKNAALSCNALAQVLEFSSKSFRHDVLVHLALPLLRDALRACGAPESRSRALAVERLLAAAAACVEAEERRRTHARPGPAAFACLPTVKVASNGRPLAYQQQSEGLLEDHAPQEETSGKETAETEGRHQAHTNERDGKGGDAGRRRCSARTESGSEDTGDGEDRTVGLLLRFVFQQLHTIDQLSGFLTCWDAAHRVLKSRCRYTPSDDVVGDLSSQLTFALLHRACLERQSGRDATLILRRIAGLAEEEARRETAKKSRGAAHVESSGDRDAHRGGSRSGARAGTEGVWSVRLLAFSLGWLLWQFPSEEELQPLLHACAHLLELLASLTEAPDTEAGGPREAQTAMNLSLFSSHLALLVPLLSLQQTCPADSSHLRRIASLVDAATRAAHACLQGGAHALLSPHTDEAFPFEADQKHVNSDRFSADPDGLPARLGQAAGGHLVAWLSATLWLHQAVDRPLVELATHAGYLRRESSPSPSCSASPAAHSVSSDGGEAAKYLLPLQGGSASSGSFFSTSLSPLVFSRDHGLVSFLLSILLLSEFPQHRAHACKSLLATLQAQPLEAQRALPILHFAASHLPALPLLAALRSRAFAALGDTPESQNTERTDPTMTVAGSKETAKTWSRAAGALGGPEEERQQKGGESELSSERLHGASLQREADALCSSLCSCAAVSPSRFFHFLGAAARTHWGANDEGKGGEGDPERSGMFSGFAEAGRDTQARCSRSEAEGRTEVLVSLWRVQQVAVVALIGHVLAALPVDKYLVPPAYRALLDISGYSGLPPASTEVASSSACSLPCGNASVSRQSCPPSLALWAPLDPSRFTPALRACLLHPLLTRLFLLGDLSPSKLLSPSEACASFPLFTFCCSAPSLAPLSPPSPLSSLSSLSRGGAASVDRGQLAVCRAMLQAVQDIARGSSGFACTGTAAPLLQHALPQIQLALEAESVSLRAQAVDLLSLFCLAGVLCPGKVKRILEKKNLLNVFQQPPEITRAVAAFLRSYIDCLLHASRSDADSSSSVSSSCVASGPLSAEEEAKLLEALGLMEEICQLGACARARSLAFLGASPLVLVLYDAEGQPAVPAGEEAALPTALSPFAESQARSLEGGSFRRSESWRHAAQQGDSGRLSDASRAALAAREPEKTSSLPLATCRFLTSAGLASLFLLPLSLPSVRGAARALAAAMRKERSLLGRRRGEGAAQTGRSKCLQKILRLLHEKRGRASGQKASSHAVASRGAHPEAAEQMDSGGGQTRSDREEGEPAGRGGNIDGETAVVSMVLLEEHKADPQRKKGNGAAAERLLADRRRAAFLSQIKAAASANRLQHPLLLPLFPRMWQELLIEYLDSLPSSETRLVFSSDGRLIGRGKNRAGVDRELEQLFEAIAPCLLNSSAKVTQQRPPQFSAFTSFLASLALVHPPLAPRAVQTLQRCLFVDAVEDTREIPDWIVAGCLVALSTLHGASITVPDFFPICCFLLRSSSSAATQGTVYIAAAAHARAQPTNKSELFRLLRLYVHLGSHASCERGEAAARSRIRALKAQARRRAGDAEDPGQDPEESPRDEHPNMLVDVSAEDVSEANALEELEAAIWRLPLETLPAGWFVGLACVARVLAENVPDPTVFFSFLHSVVLRLAAAFFGRPHRTGAPRNETAKQTRPPAHTLHAGPAVSSSSAAPDTPVSVALVPLSTLLPALLECGVLDLNQVCSFLSSLVSLLAASPPDVAAPAVCWFAVAHLIRSLADFLASRLRSASPVSSFDSASFSPLSSFHAVRRASSAALLARIGDSLLRLHDLLLAWFVSPSSLADRAMRALAVAALAGVPTLLQSPGRASDQPRDFDLSTANWKSVPAVDVFLRRALARLQSAAESVQASSEECAQFETATRERFAFEDVDARPGVVAEDGEAEDAADDGWGSEQAIPGAVAQFLDQLETPATPLVRIKNASEKTSPRTADPEGTLVLCQLYLQLRASLRGGLRGPSARLVLPEHSLLRFVFDEIFRAARAARLPRFHAPRESSRDPDAEPAGRLRRSESLASASGAVICPPQTRTDHLQLAHLVALLEALGAVRPPLPDWGMHGPLARLWWMAVARLEELQRPREPGKRGDHRAPARSQSPPRPGSPSDRCSEETGVACLRKTREARESSDEAEREGRLRGVRADARHRDEEIEALCALQIALLRVSGAHACNAPLLAQACSSWAFATFLAEEAPEGDREHEGVEPKEKRTEREEDSSRGEEPWYDAPHRLGRRPEAPERRWELSRGPASSPLPSPFSSPASSQKKSPLSRAVKFVFLAELPALFQALPRNEAICLLAHIFTRGLEAPHRAPKLWGAALFALKRVLLAFLESRDAATSPLGEGKEARSPLSLHTEEELDETLRQIEQLLGQWLLPALLAPASAVASSAEREAEARPGEPAASPRTVQTPDGEGTERAIGKRGLGAREGRVLAPFAVLAHLAEALEVLLVVKRGRKKTGKPVEAKGSHDASETDTLEGVAHLPALVLGYLVLKKVVPTWHLQGLRDRLLLPPQTPSLSASPAGRGRTGKALPGEGEALNAPLCSRRTFCRGVFDRELVSFAFVASLLPWPEQLEILHGIVCSVSVHQVSIHHAVNLLVAFALYATAPHLAVLLLDPFLRDGASEESRAFSAGGFPSEHGGERGRQTARASPRSRPRVYPATGHEADEELSRETKLREPECLYTSVTGIRWLMDERIAERDLADAAACSDLSESSPGPQRPAYSSPFVPFSCSSCLSSCSVSASSCFNWEGEETVHLQLTISPEESGLFPSFLQILPRAFLGVRGFFSFHLSPNLPYWQSLLLHAPSPRALSPPAISALSLPPTTALAFSYGQQDALLLLRRRVKLLLRLHIPSSLLLSLSPSLAPPTVEKLSSSSPSSPSSSSSSSSASPSSSSLMSVLSGEQTRDGSSLESLLRLAAPFALRELRMLLVKAARLQKDAKPASCGKDLGSGEKRGSGLDVSQKSAKPAVDVPWLLNCFDALLASPPVAQVLQL